MIRLHCVVEGQTEEAFVNGLLRPELAAHDVLIDAHRITTSRRKGRPFRGGFVNYEHLKRDLILWMKQDRQPDSWFTTMIDLYRLPNDFPGRGEASAIPDPIQRAQRLERSLVDELQHPRFFAHIQVHEIEALLFSDVAQFEVAFPEQEHEIEQL